MKWVLQVGRSLAGRENGKSFAGRRNGTWKDTWALEEPSVSGQIWTQ